MKTIKLTKNLWLHEYIPEYLYRKYQDKPNYLLGLIDPRLPVLDQYMRDRFGKPIIINNWYIGGNRQWSGLRTPQSPYYSFFSQHSYGRASDKLFVGLDVEEVRQDIIKNYRLYKPLGLTAIEANVSWLHSDLRYTNDDNILIFNP